MSSATLLVALLGVPLPHNFAAPPSASLNSFKRVISTHIFYNIFQVLELFSWDKGWTRLMVWVSISHHQHTQNAQSACKMSSPFALGWMHSKSLVWPQKGLHLIFVLEGKSVFVGVGNSLGWHGYRADLQSMHCFRIPGWHQWGCMFMNFVFWLHAIINTKMNTNRMFQVLTSPRQTIPQNTQKVSHNDALLMTIIAK